VLKNLEIHRLVPQSMMHIMGMLIKLLFIDCSYNYVCPFFTVQIINIVLKPIKRLICLVMTELHSLPADDQAVYKHLHLPRCRAL